MSERTLANILEEITSVEIGLSHQGKSLETPKLKELKLEAKNHPASEPGRDLPPIIGRIGVSIGS